MKIRYGMTEKLFARVLGAYFIVSAYQLVSARKQGFYPILAWREYITAASLGGKLLWTVLLFLGLSLLYRIISKRFPSVDFGVLIASATLLALCIVWRSGDFYLGVAAAVVEGIFVHYALGKMNPTQLERLPDRGAGAIIFAAAAAVFGFVALTSIANYRNFGTSCFDMGIFVQMLHSLKEHFTAVTTCERAGLMSHFRIHSSYIFYLFLPIYALFPRAETLLTAQAFFAVAGIVPFFLLAKKRGLKGFALVSACLVCLFYGGLVMPCYYEFHENAFLPVILMWLLYAADQKKIPLFYLMSVLTCIVKEDAALYVICIGLFFFFEEKGSRKKHGAIAAALSLLYFIFVMRWLNRYGDGAFMMSSRLGDLMVNQAEGFAGVLRTAFMDPGYLISLLLRETTLLFFVQTMLPLLFLPFLTKKMHGYLLLIPYVFMNLIIGAGYGYAADIGFQYIPGPSCLLIYLTLKNSSELPKAWRDRLMITAAIVTVVTTAAMASAKWSFVETYRENREYYQDAEACIRSVPKDASVLANTFLLPHVADRDQIYTLSDSCFVKDGAGNVVDMPGLENYDFCVLSTQDPLTAEAKPFLEAAGWTVYAEPKDNFVIIYERSTERQ